MKLKQMLTHKLVTVAMDDTLATVKSIFDKYKFHHVLVVEKGLLVGVISDRDLLRSISPNVNTVAAKARDQATLSRRAHQIMTRELITLHEDAHLKEAVEVFDNHKISCIPILDDNDKPTGILSWRDIIRALSGYFKAREQAD